MPPCMSFHDDVLSPWSCRDGDSQAPKLHPILQSTSEKIYDDKLPINMAYIIYIYILLYCYIGLGTKPPRLQAVLEDVAALVWRIGHRQPLEMLQKMDHLTVPTPDLDKR